MAEIFYWVTALVMWFFTIRGIIQSRRMRRLNNVAMEKLNKTTKEFLEVCKERIDVLARENAKLRNKNEALVEKLTDLGIKNIDDL